VMRLSTVGKALSIKAPPTNGGAKTGYTP